MRRLTILLLLFCGTANAEFEIKPFATGAFEYQIDDLTDIWLHKGCQTFNGVTEVCMGENPTGEFKLGAEFAFGNWRSKWYVPVFQAGWKHRSHWFQGAPFNNDPETYSEQLFLEFKFGGLR